MSRRLTPVVSAGVILLVAVFVWWIGSSETDQPTESAGTTQTTGSATSTAAEDPVSTNPVSTNPAATNPAATDPASVDPGSSFSNLPTVTRSELPVEALDTLDDIASGGPFDFSKDDSVFQNREGFLPDRERGHYREYTVITPGSDDRGARRIVAGADGELYYTDDHYASFREIIG